MVERVTGGITSEPLKIITTDNPVTHTIYGKDTTFLEEKWWKQFKIIAKRQPKLLRLANQAKLRSFYVQRYKYGYTP